MKFFNAIMRPGIVREVNSNNIIGNIKVSAPGLFSDQDAIEDLPPVKPLLYTHTNSYTAPQINSEVWIINYIDNPLQLYWIRRDIETINDNTTIFAENTDIEILVNLQSNGLWASLYFTNGSGWVLSYGQSKIIISANGNITITNGDPNRTISITPNSISLGTEGGSAHPAAYGDSIVTALNNIVTLFLTISNVASINPYTSPISTAITTKITSLQNSIEEIISPNVTLD